MLKRGSLISIHTEFVFFSYLNLSAPWILQLILWLFQYTEVLDSFVFAIHIYIQINVFFFVLLLIYATHPIAMLPELVPYMVSLSSSLSSSYFFLSSPHTYNSYLETRARRISYFRLSHVRTNEFFFLSDVESIRKQ